MRLLPYGDRALLVELDSLEAVHRLHRAVQAAGFATDSVPGLRTLLVTASGPPAELAERLRELAPGEGPPRRPIRHEIEVVYDGPDLEAVAAACGVTVQDVVRLHGGAEYCVAFLGFTRGFPYLAGVPLALQLPRLATPRTRVPPGSVAVAGELCGIYPVACPGGWHLLGTTRRALFDPSASPPTALSPGDTVRFVASP